MYPNHQCPHNLNRTKCFCHIFSFKSKNYIHTLTKFSIQFTAKAFWSIIIKLLTNHQNTSLTMSRQSITPSLSKTPNRYQNSGNSISLWKNNSHQDATASQYLCWIIKSDAAFALFIVIFTLVQQTASFAKYWKPWANPCGTSNCFYSQQIAKQKNASQTWANLYVNQLLRLWSLLVAPVRVWFEQKEDFDNATLNVPFVKKTDCLEWKYVFLFWWNFSWLKASKK
jgi:hypothetical protein